MRLAAATWNEAAAGGTLVLPIGACEQHGPHLPLGTDTVIVEELVARLERERPAAWVAPSLTIGASGEHDGFPGTLSIGTRALTSVLVETGRSADHFDGIFFVNWHGGNAEAINRAAGLLTAEGRKAGRWRAERVDLHPGLEGDLHAGRLETSMMLAIDPATARSGAAEAGAVIAGQEAMAGLRSNGVKGVSPNGVLGDPTGAGAGEGETILAELAAQLIDRFDEFEAGTG